MKYDEAFEFLVDSIYKGEINEGKLKSLPIDDITQIATEHRILPLFSELLNKSSYSMDSIEEIRMRNQIVQVTMMKDLLEIIHLFNENNIQIIPFKGTVLSHIIYDDIAYRMGRDIDVLIRLEDLEKAEELLPKLGFERTTNYYTPGQKKRFIEYFDHFQFTHKESGILLELHWKIWDKHPTQSILQKNALQELEIFGNKIHFLNNELLFCYLLDHAAKHDFFRLQWIMDLKIGIEKGIFNRDVFLEFATPEQIKQMQAFEYLNSHLSKSSISDKGTPFQRFCLRRIKMHHAITIRNSTLKYRWLNYRLKFLHNYYYDGIGTAIKAMFQRNLKPDNWSFFAFPDKVFFLNYIFARPIWLLRQLFEKPTNINN